MDTYTPPAMTGRKHAPLTFREGSFAEALRVLRAKAGITQADAARAMELRQVTTVSSWERGVTVPSPLEQRGAVETLRALARKAKPAAG